MEKLTVGMISGRHELPVEQYIFNEAIDGLDFSRISRTIREFLRENCNIHIADFGCCVNQAADCDTPHYKGGVELVVYVTGFTPVTAALVYECAIYGINLTLMHYDREENDYKPQRFCME